MAYTDVFGENVSLEYFSTLNGVKENIILAEYSGKNTFSFIIDTDGLVPEKMSGDSIPLLDPETGEMKLYIGQINAKDSYTGDNENDDTHFTLYNSLELEQIGNKADVYKLTIVVDREFLESETTVYPVTIDPTVSMAATNMSDAPVFSGYPTRNYYTNEYNMVGYHGSSYKEAISYVKLNTLSSYKYINPQKINLAYYRVYEGSGKTSTATINLYDTVSTWNDTTITYNNKPSFAGNAASSQTISSSGWYLFSITSLFKNWLQGTLGEGGFSHNYGFALSASTTGVSSRHFCSANSANYLPTIVVQYSEDTSIADGAYYIKSKYSNLYLDTEQNASANGNVIQYGFHGNDNQVWVVKHQSDGYYKLYSPWYDETKCLDVTSNPTQNGSNVDVYDDGDGDYLLFKLVSNNDGSYRIISKWSGNQKVLDVCGPSTAATANIQIWEYLNVDQQKWYFEPVSNGAAIAFRYDNSDTNCLGYALELTTLVTIGFDGPNETVETTFSKIQQYVSETLGRNCRRINSPYSLISQNEYRVALRIGIDYWGFRTIYDYHLMVQTNNGGWAHKQGSENPSEFLGLINPKTQVWLIGHAEIEVYSSETVFFAVTR